MIQKNPYAAYNNSKIQTATPVIHQPHTGEYSKQAVYSYLLKRLFDANIRKDPEILEEVLRHLRTMRDTWKEVMAKTANGNNIKTKEPVA